MYLIHTLTKKYKGFNNRSVWFVPNKKQAAFFAEKKFFDLIPLQNNMDKYKEFKELIIFREGGIGDVIVLSSIVEFFKNIPVKFVTNGNNKAVLEWFSTNCKGVDTEIEPVYEYVNPSNFMQNVGIFIGMGIIELAGARNWFEVFFNGIEVNENYFRPQLKTQRINDLPSNIDTSQPSLLICNKSTSPHRTANFIEIYAATQNFTGQIYVHESNLTDFDKQFILPENVKVIPKCSLYTYLLDLYDATFVISVDTAAIHFREGVQKPAIGLYSSFTSECRTKYYKYTQSYNFQSDCKLQPCFKHQHFQGDLCNKLKQSKLDFAPCLSGAKFIEFVKQLIKDLK